MPHLRRIPTLWQLRSRALQIGQRTVVMGVVNITPDSFSDGGQYLDADKAIEHGLGLLEEGADLLDLGAESTRPGVRISSPANAFADVSVEEEQRRLMPVVEGILKARPDAILSVDTYKSATARAAVLAGAQIVNDVSGLTWDPAMAATCAELGCGVVLMHTRGTPEQWRTQAPLASDAVLPLVREGLRDSLQTVLDAGVSPDAIVLDPGFGFGKRFDENYALLARQAELLELGQPLLVGLSRKSFLTRTMAAHPRLARSYAEGSAMVESASVAAVVAAILNGASVVRVHSVRATVEAAAIADAVLAYEPGDGGDLVGEADPLRG